MFKKHYVFCYECVFKSGNVTQGKSNIKGKRIRTVKQFDEIKLEIENKLRDEWDFGEEELDRIIPTNLIALR